MELEKLELELKLLQAIYQNLINEVLPKDGDLSKINEVFKKKLLEMKEELTLLRVKISQIKETQLDEEQEKERLDYLKALEAKFNDE